MAVSNYDLARQEQRASKAVATGTGAEALGAAAGIVLSILALVGIMPVTLAAVALIVLGISVFLESAAIAANFRIIAGETSDTRKEEMNFASGLSLTTLGAVAVVALGVLALLGIATPILLGAGVITLGAVGLLSSAENNRLAEFPAVSQMFRANTNIAPLGVGTEVIASLGAIVLGILALVGIHSAVMTLTGLLVVSAAMFLGSAAVAGRLGRLLTL